MTNALGEDTPTQAFDALLLDVPKRSLGGHVESSAECWLQGLVLYMAMAMRAPV